MVSGTGCLSNPIPDSGPSDSSSPSDVAGDSPAQLTVSDDGNKVDLVSDEDITSVSEVTQNKNAGYQIGGTLTEHGIEKLANGLNQVNAFESSSIHKTHAYVDGEEVPSTTIGDDFAAEVESGEWDGGFSLHVSTRADGEKLQQGFQGS